MRKIHVHFGVMAILMLLAVNFNVAFAQISTAPATTTPPPVPITREPLPPPKTTQQTQSTQTQQTAGGSAGTGTVGTAGGHTQQNLNGLVDLPVLDIGLTQETEQCEPQTNDMCISPSEAANVVLPPVIGDQLKISWLLFVSVILGTIIWIIINLLINGFRKKQERAHMEREGKIKANARRIIGGLQKSYGPLSDAMGAFSSGATGKMAANTNNIANYKKAAVGIELFGSKETLAANKHMVRTITSKSPSVEEFRKTKNELLAALKKDLGLS